MNRCGTAPNRKEGQAIGRMENQKLKLRNITWTGVFPIVVACGTGMPDSNNLFGLSESGLVTRQEAEARALELLDGRVLSSERDEERGIDVYEIDVLRASGSVVEITIVVETGLVIEVESHSPADGDDLDVGGGLLTLRQAKDIATAERPGRVVGWEIERDEDGDWEWEIEIETNGGAEVEVEVDAETGALEVDDDDDDWDYEDIDDDDIDDDYEGVLPQAVVDAALDLVAGTVGDFDRSTEDGFVVWEVEVETASGASVDLYFVGTSARLIEADGDEGPFDYAFEPSGYISLADALAAAALAPGDIESWEFERDEGRMIFELHGFDGVDVEVDALSGAVLDRDNDEDAEDEDDEDDDYGD